MEKGRHCRPFFCASAAERLALSHSQAGSMPRPDRLGTRRFRAAQACGGTGGCTRHAPETRRPIRPSARSRPLLHGARKAVGPPQISMPRDRRYRCVHAPAQPSSLKLQRNRSAATRPTGPGRCELPRTGRRLSPDAPTRAPPTTPCIRRAPRQRAGGSPHRRHTARSGGRAAPCHRHWRPSPGPLP